MKKTRLRDRKKKFYKAWQKALGAYWGMKKERDELRKQLAETQDKLEAVSEAYEKNTAQGIQYERECFDLRKQLAASEFLNTDIGAQLDEEQAKLAEAEKRMKSMSSTSLRLSDIKIAGLREQLAEARSITGKKFTDLRLQLEASQQQLATLQKSHEESYKMWHKTVSERDKLRDEGKDLRAQLAEAEAQLLDEQGNAVYWKGLARGKTANILRKKEEIATLRAEIASREKAHKEGRHAASL